MKKKQGSNLSDDQKNTAPGAPGIEPRWTSSAKSGVGTALNKENHVWFTLSHGIFNEVYFPRIDQACIRDLGLIVTDGKDFFSEEKRNAGHEVEWMEPGVPAFRLINTCREGRYRIEKEVVCDPKRDTVLQKTTFTPLKGKLSDYQVYALMAPHLGNRGAGNTARVDDYRGKPLLLARRDDLALALACSAPFTKRSAGYVGSSDGWSDLKKHKQMKWEYPLAENGNVALTGGINLARSKGEFVLALGFGTSENEAARNATASLREGFDSIKENYISEWKSWTRAHLSLKNGNNGSGDLTKISLAVLRTHESKTSPGGLTASLSIPWGFNKGDDNVGGYHLIWSRDMVEAAGGMLAAGAYEDVGRVLDYLQTTQQDDGHWSQNMWLDGSPYWDGIQMDETALPILLLDLAHREKALDTAAVKKYWPMVKSAAGYVVRNGPVSPQDRWEEDPGYSPFTVGAEIAALLAAADMAELNNESGLAAYLRDTADVWNASVERWIYMSDTDWSNRYDVEGYYVRIAPNDEDDAGSALQEDVEIKNVAAPEDTQKAAHLVSPDALALVRFGLRAADDQRILNTVKVIDALLKIDTKSGPTWHRYNGDGYGEHEDGSPFDGTGIGRGWPLLTGERAHYELAAGRKKEAKNLLKAMQHFSNNSGLLPEQVWNADDIPERELFNGKPSGSAMPLVWAHAEYLKLRRSLRDGSLFDQPPQTVKRYLDEKKECPRMIWRFNHKIRWMPQGKTLRIETRSPATVRYSIDDWKTHHDIKTKDTGVGIHLADLETKKISAGSSIRFTFYWPDADHWENENFDVEVKND